MDDKDLWQRLKRPDTPCPDALTLAAYVDGRLSQIDAERVEEHLAGCGECLQSIEIARALTGEPRKTQSRTPVAIRWLLPAAASIALWFGAYKLGLSAGLNDEQNEQVLSAPLLNGSLAHAGEGAE